MAWPFRSARARALLVGGLPARQRGDLARESFQGGDGGAAGLFGDLRRMAEEDAHGPLYPLAVYRAMADWIWQWSPPLEGKRLLELGPGWSLATGALLVAAGNARSYVGADLFPLASQDKQHYRRIRDELQRGDPLSRDPDSRARARAVLERFDSVVRLEGTGVSFDEGRVSWRHPVDAGAMPFPDGSFDVCLSNASLEHVRDPAAVARESLRVLAPGGVGLHQIDFRDHRDFKDPLCFLRFGHEEWEGLFAGPSPLTALGPRREPFQYTNRWRKSDFVRAFENAGAVVSSAQPNLSRAVGNEERARLHESFRGRDQEDLETLGALLVVRKPVAAAR